MWFAPFLNLPEWVLDRDVAVYSDGQQTENGALGEHEDEASDKQAAMKFSTETHTAEKYMKKLI